MGQLTLQNILVVCVGNICRSPVGAQALRQLLPDLSISSAGLRAVVGHAADVSMVTRAASHGIRVDTHSARQLTASLCREQDLILVMEQHHISMLIRIAPEAQGKTLLFGHWNSQMEIQDPFLQHQSFCDRIVQQLGDCAREWGAMLK